MAASKRLSKELAKLYASTAAGISIVTADDFEQWDMDIRVLDDDHPLYAHQTFRLRFRFSKLYPIEAPEVTFVRLTQPARPIPLHPHVYSNGIICLDLLDRQGWSPVHNVESICMSLQSMLAGNQLGERPEGDDRFVATNRQRPRDIRFEFHDDRV